MKRWKLWIFLIFVVLPVAAFSFYTWASLKYVYAEGERVGFVQKLSKKGWIFKTWEGELAMVNLTGTVPEIFHFSVRDNRVVEKIESLRGQRVVLRYNQHRGVPVRWFGDTAYFASDAFLVNDPQPVQSPIVP